MKIAKPHLNSAQQQDNAGHFSKTLLTAEANNSQSIAATSLHSGNIVGSPIPKSSNSDDTVTNILAEIRQRLYAPGCNDAKGITSLINDLTPEQTQQVIEGLTDNDLAVLAGKLDSGTPVGAVGGAWVGFIGMLATRLDSEQMHRVCEAHSKHTKADDTVTITDE